MFSLWEEGIKLARNFLLFWNSTVICTSKAEKRREFLGAQSSDQRQKAQLVNFNGMQLKKELCQFTRLVLHSTQNTWCIFCGVVWFHRNGAFKF